MSRLSGRRKGPCMCPTACEASVFGVFNQDALDWPRSPGKRCESMNKKRAVTILCCITTYLAGTISVCGQDNEIELKDKRVTVRTEKLPVGMVLGYMMSTYGVPIGFEQSALDGNNSDYRFSATPPGVAQYKLETVNGVLTIAPQMNFKPPTHPITLRAENERLEDVLNRIIGQVEDYAWDINDGVVNIFPVKGRDNRLAQLLDLRIKRFTLEKGSPVRRITTNIRSLPEVSAFLLKNNLRFNGARSGPEGALEEQYGRKIEAGMDFSNLTFRDLLNNITKIKGGGWVLRWRFISKKTGEELIDIDI